jgi:hypothetical protein
MIELGGTIWIIIRKYPKNYHLLTSFTTIACYSYAFGMLAKQLHSLIHDVHLEAYTIIKVKKLICNII